MRQNILRVRLLGPVDLQLDNQPLPPLDSARAESLLAYLLLHRDAPQPRQRLAFLLWPGSSEGQAQTNLRKVLHTLRRALPDADRLIEIGPRTLRWRPDAPLWLDVERFERAVADRRSAEAVRSRASSDFSSSGFSARRCSPEFDARQGNMSCGSAKRARPPRTIRSLVP